MPRISVNGVTLNVMEIAPRPGRGRKPGTTPIVMIHGLAASSAFWYAAGAPFLANVGPVVLYDLRGHGKSDMPDSGYGVVSMTDDLGALLDSRGMSRVHLVAHSFGGMIAVLYALRHPDRVASLVIVDSRMRRIQSSLTIQQAKIPPAMTRRLRSLGIEVDSPSHTDDGIGYLNNVARIQIAAEAEADDIVRAIYSHPRLFRSRRNAERWIKLIETASLVSDLANEETFGAEELGQLRQPMLVLVGAKSSTVPSARALARLCPRAILREIPDVGHFFPMSSPALFVKPAMRFLRAVEAGDDRLEAVLRRERQTPSPSP